MEHRRLAEIIEMIHTASLIHDDVLDDSDMRRGMPLLRVQSLEILVAPMSVTYRQYCGSYKAMTIKRTLLSSESEIPYVVNQRGFHLGFRFNKVDESRLR